MSLLIENTNLKGRAQISTGLHVEALKIFHNSVDGSDSKGIAKIEGFYLKGVNFLAN